MCSYSIWRYIPLLLNFECLNISAWHLETWNGTISQAQHSPRKVHGGWLLTHERYQFDRQSCWYAKCSEIDDSFAIWLHLSKVLCMWKMIKVYSISMMFNTIWWYFSNILTFECLKVLSSPCTSRVSTLSHEHRLSWRCIDVICANFDGDYSRIFRKEMWSFQFAWDMSINGNFEFLFHLSGYLLLCEGHFVFECNLWCTFTLSDGLFEKFSLDWDVIISFWSWHSIFSQLKRHSLIMQWGSIQITTVMMPMTCVAGRKRFWYACNIFSIHHLNILFRLLQHSCSWKRKLEMNSVLDMFLHSFFTT